MQRKHRISAFILALLMAIPFIHAPITVNAEDGNAVYVSDSGNDTNVGSSANSALATLDAAFEKLGSDGGTVVICGEVKIKATVTTCSGAVTITSVHKGVDFRKSGASLTCYKGITMAGALKLEKLNIISMTPSTTNFYPYNSIGMNGYSLHIGKEVECTLGGKCETYLSIVSGSGDQKLTVESGHWQRVRGNDAAGKSNERVRATINISGGTFHEKLILTGEKAKHYTNVDVTINGGEFLGGIYLVAFEKDGKFQESPSFTGDVNITVNGGNIYGPLSWSYKHLGTFSGTYDLNLIYDENYIGSPNHITEIYGPDTNSTLTYGESVDPSAIVTGEESFTTCLRAAADPFVFYHDGMYYLTSTSGTSIGLACAANLADLGKAAKTTIFTSEKITGTKTSKYQNAWSPEIHHFTDEELGEGNGGWYMFLGLTDVENTENLYDEGATEAEKQREYVLKCLDGDYLLGRWGSLEGEVNVPTRIRFTGTYKDTENGAEVDKVYNENGFCAGMSILRYDSKVYMTFVNERGRDETSERFYQTIEIVEITKNENGKHPLGYIYGQPVTICEPEQAWEKGGLSDEKRYPEVVEGCSAIYGEDGSVYLVYTGSGYWSDAYALGYMKLTSSDPLSKGSWAKSEENPILQAKPKADRDANSVNGSGHGSYFTDAEGKMWVCYHGYIGVNTASGRYAFLERIYVSEDGVTIGKDNIDIHPADANTVLTEPLNYLPLEKRVSGFANTNREKSVPYFKASSLTLENNLAMNFKVANAIDNTSGYSGVYAVFEICGSSTEVKHGSANGDLLVFSFKNLSPAMMGDTVKATLYAVYNGKTYAVDSVQTSIASYCRNMLASYSSDEALCTLIVDLLNYGATSQIYREHNVHYLVNSILTEEQKSLASADREITTQYKLESIDTERKAVWKFASLKFSDDITVNLKFSADTVSGLSAKINMSGKTWNLSSDSFVYDEGNWRISFNDFHALQMSDEIVIQIFEGDVPVSDKLYYSVESYAYTASQYGSSPLADLMSAMIKYGDSAKEYANKGE